MSGLAPTAVDQLQQQLQAWHAEGSPWHWRRWSGPVAADSQPLDLSGLTQVVDYPHRDMTITVQTGMSVAALQRVLAEHQQWLPVDVPDSEQMTIAELIVGHWYGSLVAGYGSIRDWLLGVAAIDGTGRLFHAGGRVVKNVAGYDLCKLLVGSEGKLALPVEVTLQVRSLPEQIGLVIVQADSPAQIQTLWEQARLLPIKPVVLDVAANPSRLKFAFEGTSRVLPELRDRVVTHLTEASGALCENHAEWTSQNSVWETLGSPALNSAEHTLLLIGVRPSQTFAVLQQAEQAGWQAAGLSSRGTVLLTKPSVEVKAADWQPWWTALQTLQPGLVVHAGPECVWTTAEETSREKSAWPLMVKLKHEFDPLNLQHRLG